MSDFGEYRPENPFDKPDVFVHLPPPIYEYVQERIETARAAMDQIMCTVDETCGGDTALKGILCRMLSQSYEALAIHEAKRTHRSN